MCWLLICTFNCLLILFYSAIGEGFRLISTADMYMGADIISMTPHQLLLPSANYVPPVRSRGSRAAVAVNNLTGYGCRMDKTKSSRSCVVTGSTRGSLGLLLPVEERTYRRLALLQSLLSMSTPTTCCLSARDYRHMHLLMERKAPMIERKNGILDVNLLLLYPTLEFVVQVEMAQLMGTTVDILLDNLSELDSYTSFF